MKKLLFALLVTSISYGQALFDKGIKITGGIATENTAIKVVVHSANNVLNTIAKVDLIEYLEFASAINLPVTGVAGKIYLTRDNNILYRWNGTFYNQVTVDVSGKEDKVNKGIENGYASLDASGKVPLIQINDALLGSVNYKGTYNAATNTPALPTPASGNKGFYYIVSTAGTQVGLTLQAGDWVISNGILWGKVDNNNAVTSVNGLVGSVVLNTSNVNDSTNRRYQTDAQQLNNDATSSIQAQLNSKQNTLTNPITGTLTTNKIPKATGPNSLGDSNIQDVAGNIVINGFLGVGTTLTGKAGIESIYGYYSEGNVGFLTALSSAAYASNYITQLVSGFGSDTGKLAFQGGGGLGKAIGGLDFGTSTGLFADNTLVAKLNSNGNVLINTPTDDGVNKLQVNGTITASPATLSNQVPTFGQMNIADALKANLASPTFTGVPTVPTATAGTSTTQVANAAFVMGADAGNVKLIGDQIILGIKTFEANTAGFTSGIDLRLNANSGAFNNTYAFKISNLGTNGSGGFIANNNGGTGLYLESVKGRAMVVDVVNSSGLGSGITLNSNVGNTGDMLIFPNGRISNTGQLFALSFINSTAPATNALLANGTTLAVLPLNGGTLTGVLAGTSFNSTGASSFATNGGNVRVGADIGTPSTLSIGGTFRSTLQSLSGGQNIIGSISGVSNGFIQNIGVDNSIIYEFYNGSNVKSLTILNNNAATFSSSVTAASVTINNLSGTGLRSVAVDTTGNVIARTTYPIFESNAAAVSLAIGEFYRTSTGILMVRF